MGKKLYFLAIFDGLLQAFLLHFLLEFSMSTYVGDLFSVQEILLRLASTILSVGFFCFIVRKEPKSIKKFAALALSILTIILYNKLVVGSSTHVFEFFDFRSFDSRAYGFYMLGAKLLYPVLHIVLRMIGMAVVKEKKAEENEYEEEFEETNYAESET